MPRYGKPGQTSFCFSSLGTRVFQGAWAPGTRPHLCPAGPGSGADHGLPFPPGRPPDLPATDLSGLFPGQLHLRSDPTRYFRSPAGGHFLPPGNLFSQVAPSRKPLFGVLLPLVRIMTSISGPSIMTPSKPMGSGVTALLTVYPICNHFLVSWSKPPAPP